MDASSEDCFSIVLSLSDLTYLSQRYTGAMPVSIAKQMISKPAVLLQVWDEWS